MGKEDVPVSPGAWGGLVKRPWAGIILVWLAFALPFTFLYTVSRRAVVNEVRQHARGVAIASAAGIDADLIQQVHGPDGAGSPAFETIQRKLRKLVADNPDIRYIYTMRRSPEPFAPPHAYEYVVDQAPSDDNGDGVISPDEDSEPPGTPYDASSLPAMVSAWERPDADYEITPDPPYPDLLSGYAPIRDADGRTVAIVGADITAQTVAQKTRVLQLVIAMVWLLICILSTLIIHLYYRQRDAFDEIKRLNEELAARHELIRKANLQLSAAEPVEGAPLQPSGEPRLLKDVYYLRAVQSGQAPSGVFDLDQDHVGFYLATISGSPASTVMVNSLVRIALSTLVQRPDAGGAPGIYVDLLNPAAVLGLLATLVAKELPAGESVSLLYGVLNMGDNELSIGVAGRTLGVLRWQKNGRAEVLELAAGEPLRAGAPVAHPVHRIPTQEGDRLLIADTAAMAGGARTSAQVMSSLMAGVMPLKDRTLLEQVTSLSGYRGVPANLPAMLALEIR